MNGHVDYGTVTGDYPAIMERNLMAGGQLDMLYGNPSQAARYFDGGVYGALDDYKNFSKQMIVERILREHGLRGEELLGFGDGFVEVEEIKRVGGVAVAVASDEVNRRGAHAWKRERLVRAGADVVIPEYRRHERLLRYLFAED